MAIPFSQSLRALQADRGSSAQIGLSLALILLLVWSTWFFWAPIARYESGTIAGMTRDARVVAAFPTHVLEDIRPGQRAYLRPQGAIGDAMGAIPAVVADIDGTTAGNQIRVSFHVHWEAAPAGLSDSDLDGQVEVEVERVSPATLVARASGQFLDTPAVSLSPQ
jgi:hypothetical protein